VVDRKNLFDTTRESVDGDFDSVARGPRSQALLTVLRGENPGALYTLDGTEAVVGRSPDVAVTLPDATLSRRHAYIRRIGNVFAIQDMGSTNGTFVDGVRVEGTRALEDGSRIGVGAHTVLHFRLVDAVELEAARQTHALTVRDPLTGVFNRRHLQERLTAETAYATRHGTPLSMLLLDIDHFKRINDDYGHAAGDQALCMLAKLLTKLARREDVLARYGGEEFALIARGIDREGALALAERARAVIAEQRLATDAGTIQFTVSIGVAQCEDGDGNAAQRMFEAADRALYAAKDAGRNKVSLAPAHS
jgi:two-component system, cell cycle response regulator